MPVTAEGVALAPDEYVSPISQFLVWIIFPGLPLIFLVIMIIVAYKIITKKKVGKFLWWLLVFLTILLIADLFFVNEIYQIWDYV